MQANYGVTEINSLLSKVRIFNKEIKLDTSIVEIKNITISYKENFFSFDFAALDYTNPEKNQHAYMLEGIDNDWNYFGIFHLMWYLVVTSLSRFKGEVY